MVFIYRGYCFVLILENIYHRRGFGWLVGWFGYNGPSRQYFSLYRAVSQKEGERERIDESKNVQTTPPAPITSTVGPCPSVIQTVGRPGTGRFASTIAPPDHPHR